MSSRGNVLIAALLPLGLFLACGGDDKQKVKRVGLEPLDVRDGSFGDATGVEGTGDGADGADGGVDGVDGDLPPSTGATDSVGIYAETAYPLLNKWCKSCHSQAQAPVFTNPDKALAHDALLGSQKVNFQAPDQSRIVLRLSKDNHNCPAEGCDVAAAALMAAVTKWVERLEPVADGPTLPTTGTRVLSEAESTRMETGLPPGVVMFEAEKMTLKAPMVALAVAGSGGGMVVHTPAGAGAQVNIVTAAAQATLGTLTQTFDVKEAGTYRLIGRINAPANANSSFYVKMDANPLLLWDFNASAANYVYDTADAVAGVGAAHQFNLTAGVHTIEIRQRQELTKLDALILTSDAMLDPMNVKATPREVKVLAFDLSEKTGVPGAKLTVDVIDYSTNAYMLKNPALIVPAGSLKIKNLKLLINGVFLPQHATYTVVDRTVAAPGGVLSPAALVALKDKGPEQDQFSFTFEILEKGP